MLTSIVRACTTTKALESLKKASSTSTKQQPPELQSLLEMVDSLTLSSFGPVSSYRSKTSILPDSLLEIEKSHPGLSKPFSPPSFFALEPYDDKAIQNGQSEFVSHMTTLYQDPEARFVLQVFFLPKGCVMPLHDHPRMSVISKVIHGSIDVSSYSLLAPSSPSGSPNSQKIEKTKRRSRGLQVSPYDRSTLSSQDPSSSLSILLPDTGNFHAMRALENTLFFDVLSPPYDPPANDCTYYRIDRYDSDSGNLIGTEDERDSVHSLFAKEEETKDVFFIRPFDPTYFQCLEKPWMGPKLSL